MRAKNIGASIFMMAFAVLYGYLTTGLPERTLPNTPGPPFMPWILTICLFAISAIWFFNSLKISSDLKELVEKKEHLLFPAAALGMFLFFLVALPYLGFLLGGIPFFAGLMLASGERRPLWIIVFSIAIPVFIFFLFREGFMIILPPGEWLD
ncbi:MAG: tripartite tricarboxylate transporter TctB family protein [Nitrospinaceae bacterium]|mgnify:FL=1|jgi:putative tricarboxylic transport membrane protein|nr:tripartite tricarboxylate transporter TctB family protein [Nitrospinaceae bacterium]MBT3433946.1 tripartite tricarboxylate transporter TctB family protein [Nitrospinaceae bacterium]MBT3821198.1 tripartite tricarboxylate transporter TctB family protein [Nitrospinaceae bacterium]MBT4093400.1 tripartite tricarboxylate transporter TctB family protein [Nitrospinaceae bacterium]MBT4432322.1 tripartite tricarboxylate transporter TctB family protein [Nitrospinaceae bacterium]